MIRNRGAQLAMPVNPALPDACPMPSQSNSVNSASHYQKRNAAQACNES